MPNNLRKNQNSSARASYSSHWRVLTVQDLMMVLKERWVVALLLGVLCSGLFAYYQATRPKVYQATSLLQVKPRADQVVNIKEVVDQSLRSLGFLETYTQQFKTKAFANYLTSQLSTSEKEIIVGGNSYADASVLDNRVAALFRHSITPKVVSGNPTIFVTAQNHDPEIAELLSVKAAQLFITYLLEKNAVTNSSAVTFLEGQVEELREKIEIGDRELQNYRKVNNLVSLEENQNIIVERLTTLNQALGEVKLERLELEARLEQVDKQLAAGGDLFAFNTITSFGPVQPLLLELNNLKSKQKTLSEKYFDKHPKMKENASQIASVELQLESNIQLAVTDLRNQLKEVSDRQARIEAALTEAEANSLELDRMSVEYDVLRRKLANEKMTFDQLFSRLNETKITSQLNNTNVEILDLAGGAWQIKPIMRTVVVRSGILFVVLFLGIPLVFEFFHNKASSAWDVEEFLGQHYLGGFPMVSKGDFKSNVFEGENEMIIESFRSLYSKLSFLDHTKDDALTILVTSTMPGEGKSFTSSNLAICSALHGKKTLLIDCDFRRPSQSKIFGTKNSEGSLQWLTGDSDPEDFSIDDITIQSLNNNLSLLKPGGVSRMPTELIESKRFEKMLSELKKSYEVILIDASPIGLFSESVFLAKHADATIYVCLHNHVNRHKLKHFLTQLSDHEIEILGMVFNRVNHNKFQGNSYDYNYGYGDYKEKQKHYDVYK